MIKKQLFIFFILCFSAAICVAQVAVYDVYTKDLSILSVDQIFLQPGNIVKDRKVNFNIARRQLTGVFDVVNASYFNADLLFLGQNEGIHKLAIYGRNSQEGKFISENKLSLAYAYQAQLNDRFALGLGLNAGIVGLSFQGSESNPGGSDTKPDLQASVNLSSDGFECGISANQFTNSQVKPLFSTFVYRRFYSVYFSKRLIERENLAIHLINLLKTSLGSELNLNTMLQSTIQQHVQLQAGFRMPGAYYFGVGFYELAFYDLLFGLHCHYVVPLPKFGNYNRLEFAIQVALPQ